MDALPARSEEALKKQYDKNRKGRKEHSTLREQVVYPKPQEMWPTPSATPRGAHTGTEAGEVSADGKTRTSAKGVKFGATLQTAVGSGQLNPVWVEWLMGFPIGYTDLED
tara:strand:- start:898 stop:1227 length:330 start_codon:yes stop_codon:yes gene_type:complete